MNRFLLLIALVLSMTAYGQEEYLEIPFKDIKSSSAYIDNVHLVKNEETGFLSIFAEESKTTYGFQYDENLKQVAQLTSGGLKRKYKEIIGQVYDNDRIRLLQKNKKGTKFASILYDFNAQVTEEIEYDVDMSDQKFIQSYSKGGACYVFTIFKNKNLLRKWVFKLDGSVSHTDISLQEELVRNRFSSTNIYNLLTETQGFNTILKMVKVENRLPNTLEIATEESKMYAHDNGFYWTLDSNHHYTVLLDFQLPDLEPTITFVEKTKLNTRLPASNSFIVGNVLAQIVSSTQELKINFRDIEDMESLKTYDLRKDDEITFKNSSILQEGSVYSFGATRKLEKTSKFLRKIASDKNGIALFKSDNGYRATIGGVRPQSGGGGFGAMGALGSIPIASFGAATMSFNPASFAYGSYGFTGSTRIESLFHNDFDHREGELPDNVFDQIENLSSKWLKRADDVYLIDDFVLFGNYQTNRKLFTLYKFQNK